MLWRDIVGDAQVINQGASQPVIKVVGQVGERHHVAQDRNRPLRQDTADALIKPLQVGVPLAEIARGVDVGQEETGGGCIARVGQQVGMGGGQPFRLEGTQEGDLRREGFRLYSDAPPRSRLGQMSQQVRGIAGGRPGGGR